MGIPFPLVPMYGWRQADGIPFGQREENKVFLYISMNRGWDNEKEIKGPIHTCDLDFGIFCGFALEVAGAAAPGCFQ